MSVNVLPLLLLMAVINTVSYAQISAYLTPGQKSRLDSIATQDVPAGAPGIATGIVSNGKIVYEKLAGYSNLEDSSLITKDTRFNIASNGKQFTALAILVLMDENKIRLTDDIRKYLPNIYPNLKTIISIENLLNHTSGIRDVYDLWTLQGITWWKQSFSNKDVLGLIEEQEALNFDVGTKYLYSNTNYILLAEIIEKACGKSFVAYTNELFKKLNMPNTSFESDYKKIRGPIARAYFNFNTWTTYDWIWNVCGDGNIFSTLADQLQWEQILLGIGRTKIKRDILERSQQLTANSTIKNYGYGLEFDRYKSMNYTFHEGATGAWKATVIRFPERKTSLITLTNTGKATPNTQTRQMADLILDIKPEANSIITKPAGEGSFIEEQDIIGVYQTPDNFTFQFEKKDSILYLKRFGRNDIKLEREANNIFHQTFDPDFKQEFKLNEKGEMTVTAYYTSHAPYTLTRLNADWTNYDHKLLEGDYINGEIDLKIELRHLGDRNYDIKIGKQNNSIALLVTPTKLLVNNYVIEFEIREGRPKAIYLSGDRIKRVKFDALKTSG